MDLIELDRAFNSFAQEHGVAKAFEEFVAEDGLLFRDQVGALEGPGQIGNFLRQNISGNLTWQPNFQDIAQSKDLGYTHGEWILESEDGQKIKGLYVSIWKKQESGAWKFVLDSGVIMDPMH